MNRREFLATGAAAAAAGLSGCQGVIAGQPAVEWEVESETLVDPTEGFVLYATGEVSNVGETHIDTLELTLRLLDESEQEITSRSKELSKVRKDTTREFYFRVRLSSGEASDLENIKIEPKYVQTSAALVDI